MKAETLLMLTLGGIVLCVIVMIWSERSSARLWIQCRAKDWQEAGRLAAFLALEQESRGDGYEDGKQEGAGEVTENALDEEFLVMIGRVRQNDTEDQGNARGGTVPDDAEITLTLQEFEASPDFVVCHGHTLGDPFRGIHYSAVIRRGSDQELYDVVAGLIEGQVKRHIRISFLRDDTTEREGGQERHQ